MSDFPENAPRLVEFSEKPVCVVNVAGSLFAFEEMCPHRAGPLSEAKCEQYVVTCPWHQAQFDIRSGRVLKGPAARNLKCYAIVIESDSVFLQD